MNPSPAENSFRARFCARHRLSEADFERAVLTWSFPWPARPIARVILLLRPNAFPADRTVIRRLGAAVDLAEFRQELDGMHYERARDQRTFRSRHGMKASLQRLEKLGRELFQPSGT